MKFISTLFCSCFVMVASASETAQVKSDLFTNESLNAAYQSACELREVYTKAIEDYPLHTVKKDIELKSNSVTARLDIKVPWLSELIFQTVIAYIPIKGNDAWLESSFASHESLNKQLSQGYDFCWFRFKKWNHTREEVEGEVIRHSIAPDLGVIEEGVILSKGALYTIDRRVSYHLSDTDFVTINGFYDIVHGAEAYHWALNNVDRSCIDDARWQRVVDLVSNYPQAWFSPKSLAITRVQLNEADYNAILNMVAKFQIRDKKSYTIEQVLLGERIFTGNQANGIDTLWEYYLYGFNNRIEGLSCRHNIELEWIHLSPYTFIDDLFRTIDK